MKDLKFWLLNLLLFFVLRYAYVFVGVSTGIISLDGTANGETFLFFVFCVVHVALGSWLAKSKFGYGRNHVVLFGVLIGIFWLLYWWYLSGRGV